MKFSQNLNIDTHDAFIHEEGKEMCLLHAIIM